jgi:hypothetical protein
MSTVKVRVVPTRPLNHQLYMLQDDPELKLQMVPCQKLEMKITGQYTKVSDAGIIEWKSFGFLRFKK